VGGSGGRGRYFSSGVSPVELRKKVADAEEQQKDEGFESALARAIDSRLADANARDSGALQDHLDTIKAALGSDIAGTVEIRLGGSIAKRTYVDGLSDADALVLLEQTSLGEAAPDQIKLYCAERLAQRLPDTEVTEGSMAVTVRFRDMDVQLIPALRAGTSVRIPAGDGVSWSPTVRPQVFAARLTALNTSLNGKLVPAIKVAKVIIYELPEAQRLTGYHIESLALKVFEGYAGPQTTKDMLRYFFKNASSFVREPIRDSTGQSLHVDDYLGPGDSVRRRVAAEAIARVGRTVGSADTGRSIKQWLALLGDLPPHDD
jgi:hypothetical protein